MNMSYKFHIIPDTQSHFITKVHDLVGQPSYMFFLYWQFILLVLSVACIMQAVGAILMWYYTSLLIMIKVANIYNHNF